MVVKLKDFDEKRIVSAYNQAGYQNERLHYAWIDVNNAKKSNDLVSWSRYLDVCWDELVSALFKTGKFADFNGLKASSEYVDFKKLSLRVSMSLKLGKLSAAEVLIREKEHFVKVVEERVGRGGKFVDEDGEDGF